ncbi:MAG: hypothetical protein AB1782_15955 [Cyanobacteriota bacterium]
MIGEFERLLINFFDNRNKFFVISFPRITYNLHINVSNKIRGLLSNQFEIIPIDYKDLISRSISNQKYHSNYLNFTIEQEIENIVNEIGLFKQEKDKNFKIFVFYNLDIILSYFKAKAQDNLELEKFWKEVFVNSCHNNFCILLVSEIFEPDFSLIQIDKAKHNILREFKNNLGEI